MGRIVITMKSREEIQQLISQNKEELQFLQECYYENDDESLSLMYLHEIGKLRGVIKGLKIALGDKKKLKLKDEVKRQVLIYYPEVEKEN